MSKKVAIVILNWNGLKMLQTYLSNVVAMSADSADIWVADNFSTDGSMEWVVNNHPEVRTIQLDKNYGFAEGYNRALRDIDTQYMVLLNSDVEVTEGWLTPLVRLMDENKDVAACQPKLLAMHDKNSFEYAGASGGFIDRYGYPFCRGRLMETIEKDHGQYDDATEVHWATGACLMVRKDVYWKAGGLDGRFFAHNEEIDLCWRMRLMGYRIMVEPSSKVYHVGGGTLPKGNPMKTYLNFRNNLTMLYKNLPEKELGRVMRVRWWLDYIAATKMLLIEHNAGDFKAVFRARRDFNKWKHDFDSDRLQNIGDKKDAALLKPYSLLWQYYAKGIRRYSDLP